MTTSINLRKLEYSPNENPFMADSEIRTRHKTVRTRTSPKELMDPETGEVETKSESNTSQVPASEEVSS